MADTAVWIIVAIVVVLIVIGVLVAARSRRQTQLHGDAQRIREEVKEESVDVERRAALADETAARARAARAEAEAKDAEAIRLEERAQAHRRAAAAGREGLDARLEHADEIDPKVNVDDAREATAAERLEATPAERHEQKR